MSNVSNVLDETADRSETRLYEIQSVIADLKWGLHDYVLNVQPADEGVLRHDRAALEWMHGALEDISATVTAIHRFGWDRASEQVPAELLNIRGTDSPPSGWAAETPTPVCLPVEAPDPAYRGEGNSLSAGSGAGAPVITRGVRGTPGRSLVLPVVVHASSAAQLQDDLTIAIDLVRLEAIEDGRHGILVTQHSYTEFTVTISEKVPYGETREARLLGRRNPEPGRCRP
jgi:hypothetical protein